MTTLDLVLGQYNRSSVRELVTVMIGYLCIRLLLFMLMRPEKTEAEARCYEVDCEAEAKVIKDGA